MYFFENPGETLQEVDILDKYSSNFLDDQQDISRFISTLESDITNEPAVRYRHWLIILLLLSLSAAILFLILF